MTHKLLLLLSKTQGTKNILIVMLQVKTTLVLNITLPTYLFNLLIIYENLKWISIAFINKYIGYEDINH
jgi:hypothetical protein